MPVSIKSSTGAEPLRDWTHKTADVPERGLEVSREASREECAVLAEALELLSLDHLKVVYRIRPLAGGRYALKGEFNVAATQACILTLEPVPADLTEGFEEEYWPEELLPQPQTGGENEEREALSHTAPEVIRQGVIEVGHLVYEQLSTAIDPYPRASEAAFTWNEPGVDSPAGGEMRDNPFSALAALKNKT